MEESCLTHGSHETAGWKESERKGPDIRYSPQGHTPVTPHNGLFSYELMDEVSSPTIQSPIKKLINPVKLTIKINPYKKQRPKVDMLRENPKFLQMKILCEKSN